MRRLLIFKHVQTIEEENMRNRIPNYAFFSLFLLLLLLLWLMAKPMIHAIIFGAIIGGSFYPLFNRTLKRTNWKKSQVSILMCLLITCLVFIPTIYLIFALSNETYQFYLNLKSELTVANEKYFFEESFFGSMLVEITDILEIDISFDMIKEKSIAVLQSFSTYVLKVLNSWVSNLLSFIFDFFIMILVIFALFTEGTGLKKYILELSPLPDSQEELMIQKFNQMNYVTLVCNGLGGLIQGIVAGIGFFIAGVPSTILWTVVMVLLAFIPIVGISLVYIPAAIYLAAKGQMNSGLILFIYCTMAAFFVENWFKPKFIGERIKINPLFILFCIIGGMSYFGMAGIFYGPIIGIIFLTVVELYHDHYAPNSDQTSNKDSDLQS
ncbi:MAG: hypothetical protein CMP10_20860 [Zetaproteobacteria bacterium]|nr:hypothetical protein [Pseudobdellovibrionaceae bacterium]